MLTMSKSKRIALVGVLAAVNIASRIVLAPLPNIKPVTSIIIISVLMFDLAFGVELAIVTTLVSNMYLGMGTWTFFQILAWVIICFLTQILKDIYYSRVEKPNIIVLAVFAFLAGFIFGFFVSLDHLVVGGVVYFLAYYLSGLTFDLLHALGNFVFFIACFPMMKKIFSQEIIMNSV